jgi:hypothetical protein
MSGTLSICIISSQLKRFQTQSTCFWTRVYYAMSSEWPHSTHNNPPRSLTDSYLILRCFSSFPSLQPAPWDASQRCVIVMSTFRLSISSACSFRLLSLFRRLREIPTAALWKSVNMKEETYECRQQQRSSTWATTTTLIARCSLNYTIIFNYLRLLLLLRWFYIYWNRIYEAKWFPFLFQCHTVKNAE